MSTASISTQETAIPSAMQLFTIKARQPNIPGFSDFYGIPIFTPTSNERYFHVAARSAADALAHFTQMKPNHQLISLEQNATELMVKPYPMSGHELARVDRATAAGEQAGLLRGGLST